MSIYQLYCNIFMIILLPIVLVNSFPYGIQTNIKESEVLSSPGSYSCSLCHSSSVKDATVDSTAFLSSCSIYDTIFAGVKLNGINDDTISLGAFASTAVALNKVYCDFTISSCSSTTFTQTASNGAYWYYYTVKYLTVTNTVFGFTPSVSSDTTVTNKAAGTMASL